MRAAYGRRNISGLKRRTVGRCMPPYARAEVVAIDWAVSFMHVYWEHPRS